MFRIAVLVALAATPLVCHAETRWCEVTGETLRLTYPPIALAARVSGAVVGRIVFVPGGGVTAFQPIFGPPMLADSTGVQVKSWSIRSSAQGDEPCQTLVVATYLLATTVSNGGVPAVRTEPGLLKATVEGVPAMFIDPAQVSWRSPLSHLWWKLRRLVSGHAV